MSITTRTFGLRFSVVDASNVHPRWVAPHGLKSMLRLVAPRVRFAKIGKRITCRTENGYRFFLPAIFLKECP